MIPSSYTQSICDKVYLRNHPRSAGRTSFKDRVKSFLEHSGYPTRSHKDTLNMLDAYQSPMEEIHRRREYTGEERTIRRRELDKFSPSIRSPFFYVISFSIAHAHHVSPAPFYSYNLGRAGKEGKARQAKPSQVEPSQAKPSQAKLSEGKKASQAKSSQVKSIQAKPSQAEPS
ncbi:uncharacterized protein LOC118444642 [Vespa mandarinia]|uniref:uncharacterized protein LOC118444642 n=1 Tax=Vespa mandarinia TaxID=7446 RepID=UPI00161138C0|nr:uncharacterized protein LOC118444642 [Vespa mandarinia]